ncbi:hypothetical protein [Streptomyces sp. NPDC013171]|uniref:hypothetical protein n=1 Tax=Streptomyces sp. NPDC013171 TaxID=3364863 RepID=UPI0036CEBF9A
MSGIDWGDAPTWIAAVFAGGAAWAAGLTLRSQRRQLDEQRAFIGEQSANLQLEREILRADADDRKRGQARQVTMQYLMQGAGTGEEPVEYWQVKVVNRTAEPIHDVSVQCGVRISATSVLLHGATQTERGPHPVPLGILSSGFLAEFRTDFSPRGTLNAERPVVFFKDNAGVRWRLDEHGDLSQIEVEPIA